MISRLVFLVFLLFPLFVIIINTINHHSTLLCSLFIFCIIPTLIIFCFPPNCRLLLLPWYWVVADLLATPLLCLAVGFVSLSSIVSYIITPSCFFFFPTSMSAQSKSSPSRFAEKMARIKIPGLRRSRTSMISEDSDESSSSLKTSSSSSVPEENSVGYPSTKSTSSLNTPGRSSPDRPRTQRPSSELISPSHLANLVTPPIPN